MSEFKVGDIVVCIETGLTLLTYGKEYVVVEVDGEYTSVVDDSGILGNFYSYRFDHVKQITPEQHIKEFLKKLEYVLWNDSTVSNLLECSADELRLETDVSTIYGVDDIYTYINNSYDQLTSQAAQKRKQELEDKRLKMLDELSAIDEELGRI